MFSIDGGLDGIFVPNVSCVIYGDKILSAEHAQQRFSILASGYKKINNVQ